MKVLFIHKYGSLGGVETGIRQKYLGLRKYGIDVEFLFLLDKGGRSIFEDLDIKLHHPKDEKETEDIICNSNYDVISSIDCPEVHGLLSKVSDKIKIICEVRTSYPEHIEYVENGDFPSGLRCIITPSKTYKKIIERIVGSIPVHAISDIVNERFFIRAAVHPSFSQRYIGWIGRLDDWKNYKELFSIAETFSTKMDGIEFIIVGKFPSGYDGKISQIIESFNGQVNFKWLPLIRYENIHNFYGLLRDSGGCFISTSKGEVQSNTALESMASGCPVVATDIEVFRELLDDGRCGAIYPSGDIESAAALINKVLDDKDYRQSIVENAYAKIKNGFTTDKIYTEWRNLLEDICTLK